MQDTKKPQFLNLEEYPEILTVHELSDFLRISLSTIYNRRSTGTSMPRAMKFGTKMVFLRSEVRDWLDGVSRSSTRGTK